MFVLIRSDLNFTRSRKLTSCITTRSSNVQMQITRQNDLGHGNRSAKIRHHNKYFSGTTYPQLHLDPVPGSAVNALVQLSAAPASLLSQLTQVDNCRTPVSLPPMSEQLTVNTELFPFGSCKYKLVNSSCKTSPQLSVSLLRHCP
jgi:hypothetical protein